MTLKNIMFTAQVDYEGKKCGDCARFKVPNSGCDNYYYIKEGTLRANDPACPDFIPKPEIKKKKNKIQVTFEVEDLKMQVGTEPAIINPAGGFTRDFTYEGFWNATKTGETWWSIIWSDGKECGIEPIGRIVGRKRVWKEKAQICGRWWKIVDPPITELATTWTLEDVLEYFKTQKTKSLEEIYKDIEETIKYFVDLDYNTDSTEGKYVYATCWIIATYFYELFFYFPYNLITGFSDSGKTVFANACVYQAYHGTDRMTAPTVSALFRTIESCKPTLFIDNAERYNEQNNMDEESRKIVEMIDAGFQADGVVPRTEGKSGDFKVVYYRVFCPKTITTIKGVTRSVRNRSIETTMVRTNRPEYGERSDQLLKHQEKVKQNRNNLYATRMKLWQTIRRKNHETENKYGLLNRYWNTWKPVFVIAEIFCPDKIPELLKFVDEVIGFAKESEFDDEKEMLISVLVSFWSGKDKWISIAEFADAVNLVVQQDNPKERWANSKIGKLLGTLGFKKKQRIHRGRQFWLNGDLLKKLCDQIGIELDKANETVTEKLERFPHGNSSFPDMSENEHA